VQPPAAAARQPVGDPYTLATCPVSGQKLGAEAVVKEFDGREVRFCCGGCVGKFEAAKAEYLKKIDQELIKEQRPYYPLDTCVVMGDSLTEEGKDIAVEHVTRNRLVRLCCKQCARKMDQAPEEYIKLLDEAVIKAQRDGYPLDTCPISGQKLGSMGDPVEVVIGNRLVRLCCAGCVKSLRKDPAPHLAALDAAWKAKGYPGKAR
jgi:YHS domain-containing protein